MVIPPPVFLPVPPLPYGRRIGGKDDGEGHLGAEGRRAAQQVEIEDGAGGCGWGNYGRIVGGQLEFHKAMLPRDNQCLFHSLLHATTERPSTGEAATAWRSLCADAMLIWESRTTYSTS